VKLELHADRELHVSVVDDGSGVSTASVESSRGGVKHLRQRAELLGAAVEIVGSSAGTAVRVRVPLSVPAR
jgi:signal transduction histidine kinase